MGGILFRFQEELQGLIPKDLCFATLGVWSEEIEQRLEMGSLIINFIISD